MSELIKQFPGQTYEDWVNRYLQQMPRIDDATERICEMVKSLALAMRKIDEVMVRRWVEDLVDEDLRGFLFPRKHLKAISKRSI